MPSHPDNGQDGEHNVCRSESREGLVAPVRYTESHGPRVIASNGKTRKSRTADPGSYPAGMPLPPNSFGPPIGTGRASNTAPSRQSTQVPRTNTSEGDLRRKKSLVRQSRGHGKNGAGRDLERRISAHSTLTRNDTLHRRSLGRNKAEIKQRTTCWTVAVKMLTCYLPAPLLKFSGIKDPLIQMAFREKIALCIIIGFCMLFVGFLTFGFNAVACRHIGQNVNYKQLVGSSSFAIRGKMYDASKALEILNGNRQPVLDYVQVAGEDLSVLFPVSNGKCRKLFGDAQPFPCTLTGVWPPAAGQVTGCPFAGLPFNPLAAIRPQADYFLDYDVVKASTDLLVYNGNVLNISRLAETPELFGDKFYQIVQKNRGRDATKVFTSKNGLKDRADCLDEIFRIARVDSTTFGCVVSDVLVYISLVFIMGTVGARFILAVIFQYLIGWKLGERDKDSRVAADLRRRRQELAAAGAENRSPSPQDAIQMDNMHNAMERRKSSVGSFAPTQPARKASDSSIRRSTVGEPVVGPNGTMMQPTLPDVDVPEIDMAIRNRYKDLQLSAPYTHADPALNDPTLMHTLVMIPCYSEGYASIRATLDSLAHAYYPSTHKTLFVIADGIVQGSGEAKPTPEYLIDMMEIDERFRDDDPRWGGIPEAYSYVAIANGTKRKNYARVYAGWYRYAIKEGKQKGGKKGERAVSVSYPDDKAGVDGDSEKQQKLSRSMSRTVKNRKDGKVPMILVVKVGNEEERNPDSGVMKPGNRGKRDSQVLLMQFLTKVMFDDRMTELEFDIFHKLWTITGLHPDKYEAVLMVDADTRIYPDSITHLVACMVRDPKIMGVCGETKIHNKWQSWVTMIQVYEYYISHHLSKAFESVFGGVTCLPGCFSAYRIKAPKGRSGQWVPILANPDVVEAYSENIVDTLHMKNLLLLGEDRYLTTLMLKAFPKRRNVFVPRAICKTVVPDSFPVLLSQRRRWINSTIHNLLELVLVRDLCGTFCFSMQFVIFMELVGSVVLPAATGFTIYLIVQTFVSSDPQIIPLVMLAAILGLPAVLILLTVKRLIYIFWFLVFLVALPLWQVVLPLYAFWHFDDFSWGETRKVSGEIKAEDHSRKDGEFDHSGINMKRWSEWVQERALTEERRRRVPEMPLRAHMMVRPMSTFAPPTPFTPAMGQTIGYRMSAMPPTGMPLPPGTTMPPGLLPPPGALTLPPLNSVPFDARASVMMVPDGRASVMLMPDARGSVMMVPDGRGTLMMAPGFPHFSMNPHMSAMPSGMPLPPGYYAPPPQLVHQRKPSTSGGSSNAPSQDPRSDAPRSSSESSATKVESEPSPSE
ncbi:uncharacterized protein SPPG_00877 [Spizellomyces punctatus DAOM BR117]|uniref:chitin synthase n=1 Tax=Spizellomyces punctatus (strain DAOM BR117) TaxID=645134 RepID=A0A0L0HR83_SPIPD|nr:uncharacterized protein SPPG_00877 [Spizellomyces punctatus DAOM BR117]KND03389.1 hypothetical protein SPPG_00877 [Spizellomyces punctatus DAOM BR117]|eukprot:XP_016611428.1 hypothetical protein SPPG_00877 [Spizellomyces punctatus DAOM BR117]